MNEMLLKGIKAPNINEHAHPKQLFEAKTCFIEVLALTRYACLATTM